MKQEFVRKSNLTHDEYDFFKCVKIRNIQQATAYIENGVFPVDIRVDKNEESKRSLVFYFIKEDTKDVFDKWCKYEL